MNKKLSFLLLSLLTVLFLAGCGEAETKEKNVQKEELSKYESIVSAKNHPRYLDDINKVTDFAKEHSKKEVAVDVISGNKYGKYEDSTLIFFKGFEHDGFITDIQIYLNKLEQEFSVDDALNIADSYLDSDKIKVNYEVEESYNLVPKDNTKEENIVVKYARKDENKEIPHSFYVILEHQNDKVGLVWLVKDTPKWMNFLDKNGYEKEEFEIK